MANQAPDPLSTTLYIIVSVLVTVVLLVLLTPAPDRLALLQAVVGSSL